MKTRLVVSVALDVVRVVVVRVVVVRGEGVCEYGRKTDRRKVSFVVLIYSFVDLVT